MLSGLYVLTDSQHYAHHTWLERVEQIIIGGASVIQLRDKNLSDAELLPYAETLLDLCIFYDVALIVNDRVELAKKIQADGVHLGKDDDSLHHARDYLGKNYLIGKSCYANLDLAVRAQKQGIDYVAFGSMYSSSTKPQAMRCNLNTLRLAKTTLNVPVCAIGGITQNNVNAVLHAGADMVAITHAVFNAADPGQAAKHIVQKYILYK